MKANSVHHGLAKRAQQKRVRIGRMKMTSQGHDHKDGKSLLCVLPQGSRLLVVRKTGNHQLVFDHVHTSEDMLVYVKESRAVYDKQHVPRYRRASDNAVLKHPRRIKEGESDDHAL